MMEQMEYDNWDVLSDRSTEAMEVSGINCSVGNLEDMEFDQSANDTTSHVKASSYPFPINRKDKSPQASTHPALFPGHSGSPYSIKRRSPPGKDPPSPPIRNPYKIRPLCKATPTKVSKKAIQFDKSSKHNTEKITTSKHDLKNTGCVCRTLKCFLTSLVCCVIVLSSVYVHIYLRSDCNQFQDFDETELHAKLKANLFGQEIAVNIVPGILKNYLNRVNHEPGIKPLVISIHGWTGVGKNFISRIIADFFTPRHFVKFLIPLHFPHESNDDVYYKQIVEWTQSNITQCRLNIFLFDEMDKASPGVVSAIKTSIINQSNNSNSSSPVLFLLLSNSKGADINRIVFTSGKPRSEISMEADFNDIFVTSDSWFSTLNSEKLIDNFIPFLPLEKSHIRQCIVRDTKLKNLKLTDDKLEQILSELLFMSVPYSDIQYSKTGCKRVSDKVDLVMYMYK